MPPRMTTRSAGRQTTTPRGGRTGGQTGRRGASQRTTTELAWSTGIKVQTRGREAAVGMTWEDFKDLLRKEFCPNNEMQKLETEFWCHVMVECGNAAYIDRFHELARYAMLCDLSVWFFTLNIAPAVDMVGYGMCLELCFIMVMSTPAYVDSKTITPADKAQSSRVLVPLPDDPYIAVRQARLVDTYTELDLEEAPSEAEESQPLGSRVPLMSEEFEASEPSGTRTVSSYSPVSSDSTAPLSTDHPLTDVSPNPTPTRVLFHHRTARMVVRTQPTLSPGMSACIVEAAALSPSSFHKRYRSSYETSSSSSSTLSGEDTKEDESSDADDERESQGLDDEGHGLGDKDHGLDDGSQGLEDEGLGLEEEEVVPGG
ncbi:acidic mammalian chitinase-like protein [Tanacetum coccineum]